MNQTFVIVHGERAADFEKVFGTATVAIKNICPNWAVVPEYDSPQCVFELDLNWVRAQGLRDALVDHLAERFGYEAELVDASLERLGVPILAIDCTIMTNGRDFL